MHNTIKVPMHSIIKIQAAMRASKYPFLNPSKLHYSLRNVPQNALITARCTARWTSWGRNARRLLRRIGTSCVFLCVVRRQWETCTGVDYWQLCLIVKSCIWQMLLKEQVLVGSRSIDNSWWVRRRGESWLCKRNVDCGCVSGFRFSILKTKTKPIFKRSCIQMLTAWILLSYTLILCRTTYAEDKAWIVLS